jgi:sugar phosphate isomerase/epimerase
MRIGVATYSYHRTLFTRWRNYPIAGRITLEDFLPHLKELGAEGVHINNMHIDTTERSRLSLRDRLREMGLYVHLSCGSVTASGKTPKEISDLVRPNLELARFLGAEMGCVISHFFRTHEGIDIGKELKVAIEVLKLLAPQAEDLGVKLAMENHADFRSDELVRIMTEVGSPWVGINVDIANPLKVFEDPLQAVRKMAPYALSSHIRDSKFVSLTEPDGGGRYGFSVINTCLGSGLLPISSIIETLHKENPDIALNIESIPGLIDEDLCVRQCMDYLKELVAEIEGK